MNKKTITLIVTVILTAALGFAYILSTRQGVEDEPEETPTPTPVVFTLAERNQNEITRIYVKQGDESRLFLPGEDIGFHRYAWYLADFPDLHLDNERVLASLYPAFSLTTQDRIHEDVNGLNLADFGLDPPRLSIIAHDTGGGISAIHLGNETPNRMHFFVMADGDPAMYLLPRQAALPLLQTTGDLLDRSIPYLIAEHINRFRLTQRGRETFEIIGRLGALPPSIAGRDINSINLHGMILDNFYEAFHFGDVVEMFPDDLAPFGLDDPFVDFLFDSSDGFLHLLFGDTFMREINGRPVPHIYVKHADRPQVFAAIFFPVEQLVDVNVMNFFMTHVALVNILDVERVGVVHRTRPERNLDMAINHDPDENNTNISPTINGHDIDAAAFRVLYRMMLDISADESLTPHKPSEPPEFTITYYLLDNTTITIDFFRFNDNFYSFSLDGDAVMAAAGRRRIELFFTEAARLLS